MHAQPRFFLPVTISCIEREGELMVMPLFIFITAGSTNLGFEGDWAVLGIVNTQNKRVVLSKSLFSMYRRGMKEDAGGGCKEITKQSSTHKAAEQLSL